MPHALRVNRAFDQDPWKGVGGWVRPTLFKGLSGLRTGFGGAGW